jgi:ComF family protein
MCPRCASPCPDHDAVTGPCPHCRGLKLRYEQARALNTYEGAIREAVLHCKHARYEPLASGLGWQLAQRLKALPFDPPPELIAPVPMFWPQRLWRGANSAESMAIAVAAELRLPVATDLLVCRRFLRKQSTLKPDDRRKNVRHAFRVSWRYNVKDARVLLIDDVMTTGATAQEIARVLRDAGAAAVYVAAVARGMGAL